MTKNEKDRGTSGFVSEMVNTAGEPRLGMITGLVNLIIVESSISAEQAQNIIVNCFKGKGDAFERENRKELNVQNYSEDN